MYTIHMTKNGETFHFGHVRTMRNAREIKIDYQQRGYQVEYWYVCPVDEEFFD